jgi:hypothetical protein
MNETDSLNIHLLSKELIQMQERVKQLEKQNKQLLDALIYAHKRYENVVFTKGFQPPYKKPLHPEVEDHLYYEKVTLLIESITGNKPEEHNV